MIEHAQHKKITPDPDSLHKNYKQVQKNLIPNLRRFLEKSYFFFLHKTPFLLLKNKKKRTRAEK